MQGSQLFSVDGRTDEQIQTHDEVNNSFLGLFCERMYNGFASHLSVEGTFKVNIFPKLFLTSLNRSDLTTY